MKSSLAASTAVWRYYETIDDLGSYGWIYWPAMAWNILVGTDDLVDLGMFQDMSSASSICGGKMEVENNGDDK